MNDYAALPESERATLAPLLRAIERGCGQAPGVAPHRYGATLTMPRAPWLERTEPVYLRASACYAGRPALERYVHALGFRADDDGLVRTVPTPSTFRRGVYALGVRDPGYLPVLRRSLGPIAGFRPWLDAQCEGSLVVNVPPPSWLTLTAPLRDAPFTKVTLFAKRALSQFAGLAHDLSMHALATHLVPASYARALGDRVKAVSRTLPLVFGPFAPYDLLSFYEEDLVQHCHRVWRAAPDLHAWRAHFEALAQREALEALLEARLAAYRVRRSA